MVETNHQTFGAFFEQWIIRQEHYLRLLLREMDSGGGHCSDLINQVTRHYAQYFEAKARAVEEDVFLVLAPTWLSLFERSYLWVGGFRPGMVLCLVGSNVSDLGDDQSQRIRRLMSETQEEEREIMDELNRVQEEMVSSTMMQVTRHMQNGEKDELESAIDRLKVSMQRVVECADLLRRKTAVIMLEILNPTQAVKFLAAVATLQLSLRKWGMRSDVHKA
ncbi:protein ZW2-like [Salvia miltiorrhiza]|uniref:protein ZW2-like n=1 Tax=Salvia miltiorrhiza TaxID=226208 RepID=UPI0025AD1F89|nr:protein ZW2-like [Salvia miltiorrhiza]XP_057804617.1 protein ZW2-like [Salvia miltiorrhiza]